MRDQRQQVLVQFAAARQADHRQAQTFLEDRSRMAGDRTGYRAADIGVVTDIGGEGSHLAVDEHRRDDGDVRHVRAAGEIWIVQHEGIAVAHPADVTARQHSLHAAE